MNSLFSDFFTEFWKGILGAFGTIQGRFGEVSSGKLKGNNKKKIRKLYRNKSEKTHPKIISNDNIK